jgi:hypothetical protein
VHQPPQVDLKDHKDQQDQQDHKDHLVSKAHQDLRVPLALKDHKVLQELLVAVVHIRLIVHQ